jgi:iron complex outermembrane receptor protein
MSARLAALALGTSILAVAANAQEAVPSPPLEEAGQGNEIIVFGRLSSDDILDIPQSVDVLGGDVIRDSGSETVGDALRLVPGVSRDGSTYDAFGDSFLIRGFPANQTVNGMTANALRQARDTVSISRIEVLKGPASVLYGQLQPGAVVNIVTKQPEKSFAANAGVSFGRFDDWRATLDLTGPITRDGGVRFRVAAAYDDADSVIDYWHREHFVVAPSLAFDLGAATTVTLEGVYARNKLNGFLNGLPAEGTVLPNPNGALAETLGLTDPTFDPSIRVNKEVTARIDHRFSDHIKARAGLSWTREDTDEEGVFGLLGWDEEFRTLTRAILTSRSDGDAWTAYADLAATLRTGPLRHEIVIGADHSWLDRDNLSEVALASSLDLYAPEYALQQKPATSPVPSLGSASVERNRNLGLFAQDRIALAENLRVIGGLRWSRYRQRTATILDTGQSVEEQSQTAWTSQIGVLFNPTRTISLFANRTTSFLPVSGITSEGRALQPETGVQYELGARARILDGALTMGAALFHLKRGNVAVSDRDDPSALISIGEQVSKGVELSVEAQPVAGVELYAGYALTDAETTEDTNAGLIGKRMRNVPRHSFVLRTSYEVQAGAVQGLRFGGTGTYTGARAGDLEDSFELPGYWRFDAFAQYPINDVVRIGASVENLGNRRYYTHAYSLFEVWPGAPRTWKVDLTTRF